MDKEQIVRIVELGLLCAGGPCSVKKLQALFESDEGVDRKQIDSAVKELQSRWEGKAVEIGKCATGWQVRSRPEHKERVQRFLETSPPRLSRPLLEVLSIVAYHQPVTRGDIENIRGVSTSASQLATLEQLGWVEISGRRETPGRPMLYATTRRFLDDLGVTELKDLPDLEDFQPENMAETSKGVDVPEQADGEPGGQ